MYYGTEPAVYPNSVDVGALTPSGTPSRVAYTLTGLKSGQIYYIAVTAYDAANVGTDFSNQVSAVAK